MMIKFETVVVARKKQSLTIQIDRYRFWYTSEFNGVQFREARVIPGQPKSLKGYRNVALANLKPAERKAVESAILIKGRLEPKVGGGATIHLLADRIACTVLSVSVSGKSAVIQLDKATLKGAVKKRRPDMPQSYTYSPDIDGRIVKVYQNAKGDWRVRHKEARYGGSQIRMGVRDAYVSPEW